MANIAINIHVNGFQIILHFISFLLAHFKMYFFFKEHKKQRWIINNSTSFVLCKREPLIPRITRRIKDIFVAFNLSLYFHIHLIFIHSFVCSLLFPLYSFAHFCRNKVWNDCRNKYQLHEFTQEIYESKLF